MSAFSAVQAAVEPSAPSAECVFEEAVVPMPLFARDEARQALNPPCEAPPPYDAVGANVIVPSPHHYHRHFKATFALSIIATVFNPLFGPVAIWFAVSSEKVGRGPSEAARKSCARRRHISIAVSITGLILTAAAVTIISVLFTVVLPEHYIYQFNSTLDDCVFGHHSAGVCYYDSRYNATVDVKQPGRRVCSGVGADLRVDGRCYYNSQSNCRHSRNYMNNICYTYRHNFSRDDCVHGCYSDSIGYCYYDNRYLRDGAGLCTAGGADVAGGYCYNSSSAACTFTKTYALNICYNYRHTTKSLRSCLHGYYVDDSGLCFYDSRFHESRSGNCQEGKADKWPDGFCYYSSEAVCKHAQNYAKRHCYDHVALATAKQCPDKVGYYSHDICYCEDGPCQLISAAVVVHANIMLISLLALSCATRF